MSEQEDTQRYKKAAHAMQSGVAMEMNNRPEPTEPKHLRVGVNAAMADQAGLATLLMAKGIFTREEYVAAIADAMENEVKRYEDHLSKNLGSPVTLR